MDLLFYTTVFLFLFTRTHLEIIGLVPEWGEKMIIQSDSMLLGSSRSYRSKTYQAQAVETISNSNGTAATSSDSFSGFRNSLKHASFQYEKVQPQKVSTIVDRLEAVRQMRSQSLNYLLEILFGKKDLSSSTTRNATYFTYTENETMSFSACGKVQTSDGRTIDFSMDLMLSRSFTEETASFIDYTQPVFCDPLVINLDTASANVTDQKFFFDLDADGEEEEISMLDADEIFDRLKVWIMDKNGTQKLLGLKEAGVGALYLGSSAADFSLKDAHNTTQAMIRSTGMFLYEDGRTGTLQQVDLAT